MPTSHVLARGAQPVASPGLVDGHDEEEHGVGLVRDRDTTRGAIVTAAGPGMRDVLHDLALPSFRAYAQQWGYAVHAVDLARDGRAADADAQRAKWAKLGLIRAALADHAVVVWLDADVVLLRQDEDVARLLRPRSFQGLVLEHVPAERRVNPNTGVWVLRSCPITLAFLDAVELAGPQPGPWADQGAVLAALGWDRGDGDYLGARPGAGNAFSRRTTWLPPRWNQPYTGERDEGECFNSAAGSYLDRPCDPDPCALHFMGLTPAGRARRMREAVERRERAPDLRAVAGQAPPRAAEAGAGVR